MIILIVEPDDYSTQAIEKYQSIGDVIFGFPPKINHRSVEAVVVRLGHNINREFLSNFPALKYVVSPTTGLTHIDLKETAKKNIRVLSLRDLTHRIQKVTGTPELAWGLLLALVRKIPRATQTVAQQKVWNRYSFIGSQLSGKVLGVIGYGRIGRQLAEYGKAFSMEVKFFDPYVGQETAFKALKTNSLEELLTSSKHIILAAAYDQKNPEKILSANTIRKIQKGTYLVNIARGELVDEVLIADALKSKILAGYATDVISGAPNIDFYSHPLTRLNIDEDNILITPHIGGCCTESMEMTENLMAEVFLESLSSNN